MLSLTKSALAALAIFVVFYFFTAFTANRRSVRQLQHAKAVSRPMIASNSYEA